MSEPARELLTVVQDGLEVPGLTVYGLFPGEPAAGRPHAPDGAWPEGSTCRASTLWGEGWLVVVWDVALARWPDTASVQRAVGRCFEAVRRAGGLVAWVGLEGYFCDPPDLFSPDCMSGGVLAAATVDGRLWLDLDVDAPLSPLPDDVLLALRQAAAGVADAPGAA